MSGINPNQSVLIGESRLDKSNQRVFTATDIQSQDCFFDTDLGKMVQEEIAEVLADPESHSEQKHRKELDTKFSRMSGANRYRYSVCFINEKLEAIKTYVYLSKERISFKPKTTEKIDVNT